MLLEHVDLGYLLQALTGMVVLHAQMTRARKDAAYRVLGEELQGLVMDLHKHVVEDLHGRHLYEGGWRPQRR